MLTVWTLFSAHKYPTTAARSIDIICIMMRRDTIIIIGSVRTISDQQSTQIDPYRFYMSIVTFEHLYFATTTPSIIQSLQAIFFCFLPALLSRHDYPPLFPQLDINLHPPLERLSYPKRGTIKF